MANLITQVGSGSMKPTGVSSNSLPVSFGGSGKILESITVDAAGRITAASDKLLNGISASSYSFHEPFYNQTAPFAGGLITKNVVPGSVLSFENLVGIDNTQGNYIGNPALGLTTGSGNIAGTTTGATLYQPTAGTYRAGGPSSINFITELGLQNVDSSEGGAISRFGLMCPTNDSNVYTYFPYNGVSALRKPKHGVYFECNGDGVLLCVCRRNNVETTYDAGLVNSSYALYKIFSNGATGGIEFSINGFLKTIIYTNIPIAHLGIHFHILRNVASSNTAQMYIKQYALEIVPPNPYF